MPAEVGSAYVKIKPDFSGLNAAVARQVSPIANQFGSRFGKAMGPVMAQQSKHLRTFTTAAKYATIGAAGLATYGFKDVVEAGMQFEKQMDVNAAVSEASRKQMVLLEKQAIKLGKATFFSANESAEAQAELIKGGLKVKQVLGGGLPAALSLAEAGQLDLAVAAESTVNAMKLFGLEGKEASSVADMLSTAANRTTADVLDFAMALKQGGSVTKLAGYDMNETVTVLEALAESGIKNSDAGTSMKAATIQLLKPTEKQEKLARLLNIHWETQSGRLKSAAGLSRELRVATEGMTKSERAKTLATLAGTDGVRTLNALYAESPKELEALERANARQGTAQEIAIKKMGNLAGQVEQFKGSLETAEIQIYRGMAPALSELAEEATKAANNVTKVFEDPDLSGGEKVEKAIEVLGDELGGIWERNHITEHLVDVMDRAIPVIAEHAGKLGFEAVKGFARGFLHADPLGKAVMATWALNFIGGKAAFVGAGRFFGLSLGKEIATTAAATAATQMAVTVPAAMATASAATGAAAWTPGKAWLGSRGIQAQAAASATSRAMLEQAFGGYTLAAAGASMQSATKSGVLKRLATKMGSSSAAQFAGGFGSRVGGALKAVRWGRIGALGIGLTLADNVLTEFQRRADEKSGDLLTELGAKMRGKELGLRGTPLNINIPTTGEDSSLLDPSSWWDPKGFFSDTREEKSIKNITAQYEEMARTRVKLSSATISGLHAQAEELDLTKQAREQLEQMFRVAEQGRDLGLKVDLGMDPEQLRKITVGFSTLRSGVLTSMQDINSVTRQNMEGIASQMGTKSKEGRQAVADNYRAAVVAIGKAMANGDISVKQGLARQKQLFRDAKLISGDDPLDIAKGFSNSWKKAHGINNQQRQRMLADLGKMPEGARQKAYDSMVGFGQGLVRGGKIPKQDLRDFKSAALAQFDDLRGKGTQSSLDLAIGISKNFGSMGGAVATVLQVLKDNTNNSLGAFGAKPLTYAIKAVGDLLGFGGGKGGQKKQTGGFIVPGTGSGDTFRTALPPGSFIENREAARSLPPAFQSGGLMPVALEPGERAYLPHEVKALGMRTLEARNRAVPRFQKGGQLGPEPQILGPSGPLRSIGQGAVHQVYEGAKAYLAKHKPKGGMGSLGTFTGPPPNFKQLGDNSWVDSHTLHVAQWLAAKFGVPINSTWRSIQHNREVGGVEGSLHTHGSLANPGAVDFGTSPALLSFAKQHIAGLEEALIHDAGSGLHTHLGFFQRGGLLQRLASGGAVVKTAGTILGRHGLDLESSAGIMGNSWQESGWDTEAMEPGTDNGGLFGFTAGEKSLAALRAFAARQGKPWSDTVTQVQFMLSTLPQSMRNAMNDMGSLSDTTSYFMNEWERPNAALANLPRRIEGAEKAAKILKGGDFEGAAADKELPKQTGVKVKGGETSTGGGTFAPGKFKVFTEPVDFGSLPDDLRKVRKELEERRDDLSRYRYAAGQAKDKEVKKAIKRNIELIRKRIQALLKRQAQLLAKRMREKLAQKIVQRGTLPVVEAAVANAERIYNEKAEYAEQVVALEPEEGPQAKAYIEGQERPAWEGVMGQLAVWRNTILGGEEASGIRLRGLEAQIEALNALKTTNPKAFKKRKFRMKPLGEAISKVLELYTPLQAKNLADLAAGRFTRQESGELHESLTNVQGAGKSRMKLDALPFNAVPGAWGGLIWQAQTSIRDLQLRLKDTGGAGEQDNTELLELQKQLTREANERTAIAESRFDVFKQFNETYPVGFPFAGKFHTGGVAPGPPSRESVAIVKGGEPIFTPEQAEALGGAAREGGAGGNTEVTVNVYGEIISDRPDPVEVLLGDRRFPAAVRQVAMSGRLTPGGR